MNNHTKNTSGSKAKCAFSGYGANESDWFNFDVCLGLGEFLLPVVSNPRATISPKSSLKQIGKVPSVYNLYRQIVGIKDWTRHKTTSAEIDKWSKEPDYGICVRMGLLRALDGDITDQVLAHEIEALILDHIPGAPVRRRSNSPKFLIPFIVYGKEFPKRVLKAKDGMIEFLADRQQGVLIGTHPSGVRYEGLENVDSFPELTPDAFESLWQALVEKYAIEPPAEGSLRKNPSTNRQDAIRAAMRDPVVQFLEDNGHVIGLGGEAQIFLRCPFSSGHTDPNAPDGTSTAYLPAGTRDYQQGHFRCLHASCAQREDSDFLHFQSGSLHRTGGLGNESYGRTSQDAMSRRITEGNRSNSTSTYDTWMPRLKP